MADSATHSRTGNLPAGNHVIEARGLAKRYGDMVALDGLELSVPEGTILGLLGPNGAGKTTTVSILTTLVAPDAGTATVAGADLLRSPGEVRRRIGLSGQYAAVDEHLTGFENLNMTGRLYRLGAKRAATRARELLDLFSLEAVGHRQVRTYSGGMRRRLDLASALVAAAPVLFLDEPTTGLDPRSRAELWDVIRDLVSAGSTVLLTTQYMDEADQLADDIVVINHGRKIAHGTAHEEPHATAGGSGRQSLPTGRRQLAPTAFAERRLCRDPSGASLRRVSRRTAGQYQRTYLHHSPVIASSALARFNGLVSKTRKFRRRDQLSIPGAR